jgi:predicted ribosomally synthesized peptide with nif11-like leader
MSIESAREFVKKFSQDKAFRESIENAPDDQAKQAVVTSAGFDFTKDDLKVLNQEGIESIGDDVALPQSSGTWVGVGAGITGAAAGTVAAGAGVVAAGAGIAGAIAAGASASAAAV